MNELEIKLENIDYDSINDNDIFLLMLYKNKFNYKDIFHYGGFKDCKYGYYRLIDSEIYLKNMGYIIEEDNPFSSYNFKNIYLSASGLYYLEWKYNREYFDYLYKTFKGKGYDLLLFSEFLKAKLFDVYFKEIKSLSKGSEYKEDILETEFIEWCEKDNVVLRRSIGR